MFWIDFIILFCMSQKPPNFRQLHFSWNKFSPDFSLLKIILTTEPAQNGPILFNEILSHFSETTDQNCKSCSQEMPGENFDLQAVPKTKVSPPPRLHGTKEPGHNRNLNARS